MKAQENSTKAKDSAREPALVRRLSGPVAVNSARELVPCSAARVRTHVAEAAEAARVSLHRAREAACARMCAQPPVFVSTTQNKTNKAATGPMFSSFESKTTACFRECRTKRKPPAKRTETHLPPMPHAAVWLKRCHGFSRPCCNETVF